MTERATRAGIKQLGKKGLKDKKEMAAITPALKAKSKGVCMRCGKPPDFRGLSKAHKTFKSQGGANTVENVELLCGKCHDDDHLKTTTPKRRDRTHDWEKQGMRPV